MPSSDLVLSVAIAPDAALARLRASINRPPKRLLGVLKVGKEYVGVVERGAFEIWERRDHAIHAHGRASGQRGGTRIDAAFSVTPRTRLLVVVFFGLYALAAAGIALLPSERPLPVPAAVAAGVGALVLAGGFTLGARRQRAELRRFLSGVFEDVRADDTDAREGAAST